MRPYKQFRVPIAVWIALSEILRSHDYAADLTAKDQALARAQNRARIIFDCRTPRMIPLPKMPNNSAQFSP